MGGTTGLGAVGLIWVAVEEGRWHNAPECKSYRGLSRDCESSLVLGRCHTLLPVPGYMNWNGRNFQVCRRQCVQPQLNKHWSGSNPALCHHTEDLWWWYDQAQMESSVRSGSVYGCSRCKQVQRCKELWECCGCMCGVSRAAPVCGCPGHKEWLCSPVS